MRNCMIFLVICFAGFSCHKSSAVPFEDMSLMRVRRMGSSGESSNSQSQDDQSQGESSNSQSQDDQSQGESSNSQSQDDQSQGESSNSQYQDDQSQGESSNSQSQDDQSQGESSNSQSQDDQSQGESSNSQSQDDQSQGESSNSQSQDDQSQGESSNSQSQDDQSQGESSNSQSQGDQSQGESSNSQSQDDQSQGESSNSQSSHEPTTMTEQPPTTPHEPTDPTIATEEPATTPTTTTEQPATTPHEPTDPTTTTEQPATTPHESTDPTTTTEQPATTPTTTTEQPATTPHEPTDPTTTTEQPATTPTTMTEQPATTPHEPTDPTTTTEQPATTPATMTEQHATTPNESTDPTTTTEQPVSTPATMTEQLPTTPHEPTDPTTVTEEPTTTTEQPASTPATTTEQLPTTPHESTDMTEQPTITTHESPTTMRDQPTTTLHESTDTEQPLITLHESTDATEQPATTLHEYTDPTTMTPTCKALMIEGEILISEAEVGVIVTAKCESGLFEGSWNCTDDEGVAVWKQIECIVPAEFEFANTPVSFNALDSFLAVHFPLARNVIKEALVSNPVLSIDSIASLITNKRSFIQASEILLVMTETMSKGPEIDFTEENITDILTSYETLVSSLDIIPTEQGDIIVREVLYQLDVLASKIPIKGSFGGDTFKMNLFSLNSDDDLIGIAVDGNSMVLPTKELFEVVGSPSIRGVSFFFKNLSRYTVADLVSPVLSTTLFCGEEFCNTSYAELSNPVRITMRHQEILNAETHHHQCSFLSFSDPDSLDEEWSNRGCVLNSDLSSSTHSVCECDHLTHFAILLSPGATFSSTHTLALRVIGYVGVSLSVVAMAATIFILAISKPDMRSYIHINLCTCLMAAQLLFVIAVDKTGNKVLCSVIALVLQYLFLASFMWMLMEGVVLYVLLVVVFIGAKKKKYLILFTVLSYGLPALYVALIAPIGYLVGSTWSYGSDSVCWLRYDTNFIWSFIVPVVVIILINVGFFFMTIYITWRHQKKKKSIGLLRHWLKVAVSLSTIMGLTWISGVVVFHKSLVAVAYIFTIFVAFQGLAIFILFIVMSKTIREGLLNYLKKKTNQSTLLKEWTSSTSLQSKSTIDRKNANIEYYKNLRRKRSELMMVQQSELDMSVRSSNPWDKKLGSPNNNENIYTNVSATCH